MTNHLSSIEGLLIDIEGVLIRGNEVIPGAHEALHALRARGIPHRPLALLTQPEDFVPAQTGRGNRNLFASDASLHRTCPLHNLWPG